MADDSKQTLDVLRKMTLVMADLTGVIGIRGERFLSF